MENVKFEIPQWEIDVAVEGLQAFARRLEAEVAALAQLNTPDARALAAKRLEQARDLWRGHEFYISL